MRDRGNLLVPGAAEVAGLEEGRTISRRKALEGLGLGAMSAFLLSACGSEKSPVLDPTATVPGTDNRPSAEKSPGLIIDEQAFNNWGSMTSKERELAAIDCLAVNGAQEPLPSYNTGAGSHRDVPELWRWLRRRGLFIQKVYEENPTIAEYLVETIITNESASPLKDMQVRSPFESFGMWKTSDIGNYRRAATNEKFTGFVAMCREIDERARDVSGLSVECSFREDAEGNKVLKVDKAVQCFLGDDPSPAVQKFIVDNA